MLLNYHNNHSALQSKVSKNITGSNEITHTRPLRGRRGSLLLLLADIKLCFQTQNFIARSQAHKCRHILHSTEVRYGFCQGYIIAFLMLGILAEVPGLETLVTTRDSQLSFTRNKMKTIPRKKLYLWIWSWKICSVYPKTEGKWKQQKCIFFLCFRYSHSLKELRYLLGGWVRISVHAWLPALHCWREVSWLGQNPDLCAGEAAPRDTSRSHKSLMAELRRESRS